jgi:uncharacterized membrane protein
MNETISLFKFLLTIHITSGGLGLLLGSLVLFLKKGNNTHRQLGKGFAVAMLLAGFSSFGLAVLHPNQFLFSVGIFTIFMTITGWRYLYLKNIANGQKVKTFDWIVLLVMAMSGLWLIGKGIDLLVNKNTFGIVLIVFGITGFLMILKDYKIYTGNLSSENYWLTMHLQRMIGAYIASLTAFIVVNAPDNFALLSWLLPGAILTPLIIKWTRKYEKK